METNDEEISAIKQVLSAYYFQGIYQGNVELLRKAFQPGSFLFGDINGQPYSRTLDGYLDAVGNRISPKDSGKPYQTEIISIDVIHSIAIAKVRLKMYEFNYYDLLSFYKNEGQWVIVNKMFTHVAA